MPKEPTLEAASSKTTKILCFVFVLAGWAAILGMAIESGDWGSVLFAFVVTTLKVVATLFLIWIAKTLYKKFKAVKDWNARRDYIFQHVFKAFLKVYLGIVFMPLLFSPMVPHQNWIGLFQNAFYVALLTLALLIGLSLPFVGYVLINCGAYAREPSREPKKITMAFLLLLTVVSTIFAMYFFDQMTKSTRHSILAAEKGLPTLQDMPPDEP